MVKILIADDHTIVREGLKQILRQTQDVVVADEAASGEEVIQRVSHHDYDLVLLDISLPGRSGLDILKQVKSMRPQLPVLVLSMHPEEQYAIRSIRAGASGYLTKESASEELIDAIRKVAKGRRYITASLAEKLAFQMEANGKATLHEALSDREYQVLCMIASGKTAGEIALALSLSVKTISTHRTRILKKMGMQNNAQLTHYAIKQNLVD
jgi:two-component system invasion response regulator UvrY